MKKVLSLILTLIMMVTVCVPAFAVEIMDSGTGDTIRLNDQGKTQLIMHTGNVKWDETSEGYTASNWKHSTLALRAWNKMFPSYTCPGVMSYTRN